MLFSIETIFAFPYGQFGELTVAPEKVEKVGAQKINKIIIM